MEVFTKKHIQRRKTNTVQYVYELVREKNSADE